MSIKQLVEYKDTELDFFFNTMFENINFYCDRFYTNDGVFKYHLSKTRCPYNFAAWVIDFKNNNRTKIRMDFIIMFAKLLKLPTGTLLFADMKSLVDKNIIIKQTKNFCFHIHANFVTDGIYFYSKARDDFFPHGSKFLTDPADIKTFRNYSLNDKYYDFHELNHPPQPILKP